MVAVDTDVLVIEFLIPRDARYPINHRFLTAAGDELATTVYNLLEFLGKASFNLSRAELTRWGTWLCQAYGLAIMWPNSSLADAQQAVKEVIFDRPLDMIVGRGPFSYKDAEIFGVVERTHDLAAFVTWNARHFKSRGPLAVYTPEEFLAR